MSMGEYLFVAMVVGSFVVFGLVLAGVSWAERSWAAKKGK